MQSDVHDHRIPELRALAMPADTNPSGDIFGGWLLAQMDLAGGTFAAQLVGGRVATVGIEAMSFHRPVLVGDLVSCYCDLARTGRTSLAVHVESWARRFLAGNGGERRDFRVTQGVFTFVALEADGGKRVLPASIPSAST